MGAVEDPWAEHPREHCEYYGEGGDAAVRLGEGHGAGRRRGLGGQHGDGQG